MDEPIPAQPPHQDLLPPQRPQRPGPNRLPLILALAVGLPVFIIGGVLGNVAISVVSSALLPDPAPPHLTAAQLEVIDGEVDERAEVVAELDDQRYLYESRLSEWDQSLAWADEFYTSTAAPTPAAANPGGDAMPGDDPYGRVFLDSIGATDVTVVFEAGPENCGYYGNGGQYDYYVGGCFDPAYPNTLFMAWDPGGESLVRAIFVHEAMHWFQDETYIQDTYLADFDGIDFGQYSTTWEADASCRAVYVYGVPIEEYVDSTSPCTIVVWYEGFIADHLVALGADLSEPDPADFETTESSRP
jgi:hypothetical protein